MFVFYVGQASSEQLFLGGRRQEVIMCYAEGALVTYAKVDFLIVFQHS